MSLRNLVTAAVAAVSILSLTACGGRADTGSSVPGISNDEVLIGTSYPLTGPQSAFGNGAKALEAYADYINAERGGVKMGDGVTRKLRIKVYDDGYDPAKAVSNIRRLVEQDKVFAVHNVLGTPTQAAVIDYINEKKVPDVYVASVGGAWSQNATKWPWTVGFQPTIEIESKIYAKAIEAENPNAKVAVLYQNDDTGVPALAVLKKSFEGTGVKIVRAETYAITDATVDSQVAALADTKADYFINLTGPKAAAQSISRSAALGWKPKQFVLSVSTSIPTVLEPAGIKASTGIYSAEYLKLPGDPQWANDKGLSDYREIMQKYGKGIDVEDRLTVYGYTAAQALVGALAQTKEPTRESFMDSVRNLELEIPTLLPGAKVETNEHDILPVRQMQLQQFDGKGWKVVGKLFDGSAE